MTPVQVAIDKSAYVGKKALEYDNRSDFDKGDRQRQLHLLDCLLQMDDRPVRTFCDLGCGSGFLSEQVCRSLPNAQGICIDISDNMLELAQNRLKPLPNRVQFMQADMRHVDWTLMQGQLDLVVSCLAIHHLDDAEKSLCFQGLASGLAPGGRFILYDLARDPDQATAAFLERLAITDIRSKFIDAGLMTKGADGASIAEMITKDREIRTAEGDQESSLDVLLASLKAAGFDLVCQFHQDSRMTGIYAQKPLLAT